MSSQYDVVVVGAGNAAMCAALAAAERGASVLVLERTSQAHAGGNTRFTAGAVRVAYDDAAQLRELMDDLTDAEMASTDFGSYPANQFYDDLCRISGYRTDADLADLVATASFDTALWMRSHGVRFAPIWGRQAFKVDGKFKFWGGLTVEAVGGGEGLFAALRAAIARAGAELWLDARATELCVEHGRVVGVKLVRDGTPTEVRASSVVLAAGGFQANTEWRTRYLGPGWDMAKVRGTHANTGDGIAMALAVGASSHGNWSGAHAVAWDANAPEFGDLAVGDGFQKHSYPFGVVLNRRGERFIDEGADFRNYTYARYGREILAQDSQVAWQVFDAQVDHLLRDEYRIRQVTKSSAGSLEELCEQIRATDGGFDAHRALATLTAYNDAVDTATPFNPNVLDGRRTHGLTPNKTNWANPLTEPPFSAFCVTCGLTFTFGGLRVNTDAAVLDTDLRPIAGLFAAGELVGGLFYGNYPGGSGLAAGAVIGRTAGTSATTWAREKRPSAAG